MWVCGVIQTSPCFLDIAKKILKCSPILYVAPLVFKYTALTEKSPQSPALVSHPVVIVLIQK